MLYRASIFAAILAAGAKAVDEATSYIEETQAESCALQVKGGDDGSPVELTTEGMEMLGNMQNALEEYSHNDL
jgi:hypothetical protein